MKLHKMIEVTKVYISLEILSSKVVCPCPGAIYMYIMHIYHEQIHVKSEFRSVLLKLSADDQ